MKHVSLRTHLGVIYLGFLLLIVSSVGVTFWLVQTQQHDAAIINLAGRQRMLAQQMTRLALTDPENPELTETIARFEQTLTALSEGGEVMDGNGRTLALLPPTNTTIHSRLADVTASWPTFRSHLQPLIDNTSLQTEFAILLTQLDDVVNAYEAQAQVKISRLRGVQFAFLIAAFLLLAWGYRTVHRQLLQPLVALGAAAQAIGAGRLDKPVPVPPGIDLGRLAQTMETMRGKISAYQSSLAQQVAQRTQELTAAFEFSQEIVRELESDHLLQSVVRHTRDLMQGEAASVCVLDGDGRTLELVAGSGAGKSHLGLRQSTEYGVALPVIHEHKTIIAEGGCANCHFLHHFPGTSCIATPLQVGGRSLGALCVVRPQRPFDNDEARALTLLANAAAIALENARLIKAGKQQAKENASLAERERLAADLHDNLAQTLGAMHLGVDLLAHDISVGADELAQQRIIDMQTNLRQAYAQVRMALTGLRETVPEAGEFVTVIKTLLVDFEEQSGLPARLMMMDEDDEIRLTAVNQKQALHIIREALTNIRRHAQATEVRLTITRENDSLVFAIADDGLGFDPNQVNSQNHLGLTIMRTRAKRSQGQFTLCSTPGEGTQITVTLPLHNASVQNHLEPA